MTEMPDLPPTPGRDEQGRFAKGRSGNPKGRPKKGPRRDMTEWSIFGDTAVDVIENGKKTWVTRTAAVRKRMFKSAMDGDVRAQMFFDRKVEEAQRRLATLRTHLRELELYYVSHPELEMPIEAVAWRAQVRGLLRLPLDGPAGLF
jgi:hypothetical protein